MKFLISLTILSLSLHLGKAEAKDLIQPPVCSGFFTLNLADQKKLQYSYYIKQLIEDAYRASEMELTGNNAWTVLGPFGQSLSYPVIGNVPLRFRHESGIEIRVTKSGSTYEIHISGAYQGISFNNLKASLSASMEGDKVVFRIGGTPISSGKSFMDLLWNKTIKNYLVKKIWGRFHAAVKVTFDRREQQGVQDILPSWKRIQGYGSRLSLKLPVLTKDVEKYERSPHAAELEERGDYSLASIGETYQYDGQLKNGDFVRIFYGVRDGHFMLYIFNISQHKAYMLNRTLSVLDLLIDEGVQDILRSYIFTANPTTATQLVHISAMQNYLNELELIELDEEVLPFDEWPSNYMFYRQQELSEFSKPI